ncbi:hypothetical protein BIFBIF_02084 [Bifidobacterium bifidum ATCC 29521 = JCM 1255 = DSM 20456]|nr:hypothetical protein BIFBIF_02084 [Bifidobacterium bifidum ATCC 29521 = JCM 1255 = DSM 20456]
MRAPAPAVSLPPSRIPYCSASSSLRSYIVIVSSPGVGHCRRPPSAPHSHRSCRRPAGPRPLADRPDGETARHKSSQANA